MSMVLFLTNCSLTKAVGGAPQYAEDASIAALLPPAERNALMARRRDAYQLVRTDPNLLWQGTPVGDLEFNRDLKLGPDLGGKHSALYLPACERYEGRFFQAMGENGRQLLRTSEHHVLFLSGLYGILRACEPVQLYSCPLADPVARLWEGPVITDALCVYIERFGIGKIFDLTAIDAYRALVDWGRIADTGTEVLHAFDVMAKGDSALTSFGKCLGRDLLLRTEDELIALAPETRIHTVMFRSLGLHPRETAPPSPLRHRGDATAAASPIGVPWQPRFEAGFADDARRHMNQFTRIMQATVEVCQAPTTPRGNTVKRLKGEPHKWRFRFGDFRVKYRVEAERKIVRFLAVGPRGGIYC